MQKGEEQVPYLLIYKKGTNIQANTSVSVNEASYNDVPSNDNKFIDEPGLVDFSISDDNVNSGKKRKYNFCFPQKDQQRLSQLAIRGEL